MVAFQAPPRLTTRHHNSLTGRDVIWGQYSHIDRAGNIACAVEKLHRCTRGNPNITSLHYTVSYESHAHPGIGTIVIAIDVDPIGSQAIINTIESGRLYNANDVDLARATALACQSFQETRGERTLHRLVCMNSTDRRGLVKAATLSLLGVGADVCEAHASVHRQVGSAAHGAPQSQSEFSMDLVVRLGEGRLEELKVALRRLQVDEKFSSITEFAM